MEMGFARPRNKREDELQVLEPNIDVFQENETIH
jgi:hypothetical protein